MGLNDNEIKRYTKEMKALNLLLDWAIECDFGLDNFPEQYHMYKDKITDDMSYKESMLTIAKCCIEDEENDTEQQSNNINEKMVYHPEHYNKAGKKECWDEMEEKFGGLAVFIFDALSGYKYKYRAGEKEGNPKEQDFSKLKNYIQHAKKHKESTDLFMENIYKFIEENDGI